jgi:hypothetical protein
VSRYTRGVGWKGQWTDKRARGKEPLIVHGAGRGVPLRVHNPPLGSPLTAVCLVEKLLLGRSTHDGCSLQPIPRCRKEQITAKRGFPRTLLLVLMRPNVWSDSFGHRVRRRGRRVFFAWRQRGSWCQPTSGFGAGTNCRPRSDFAPKNREDVSGYPRPVMLPPLQ